MIYRDVVSIVQFIESISITRKLHLTDDLTVIIKETAEKY